MFSISDLSALLPPNSARHQELPSKVADLDCTEDGEAGEEPHRASNQAELARHCHLHVPLDHVEGGSTEIYLDQLQGGVLECSF